MKKESLNPQAQERYMYSYIYIVTANYNEVASNCKLACIIAIALISLSI